MRRQLRIIGGYEVKTEGDAFMVSFPTPTSALLWCFAVQTALLTTDEWPAEILASDQGCEVRDEQDQVVFRGLSVRMGIHWGTPVCEHDLVTRRMDYFGPMVNRASRVSSVADGGQITISTDYYNEFEKIKEMHNKVKNEGVPIAAVYPNKALGEVIEGHMEKLEEIGWVQESIGSTKLKGLETPEKIWLMFPGKLASRLKVVTENNGRIENNNNKNNKVIAGINAESVWRLRNLSLRLEEICSYLGSEYLHAVKEDTGSNSGPDSSPDSDSGAAVGTDTATSASTATVTATAGSVSGASKPTFLKDLVSKNLEDLLHKESDMISFVDHLVTRVENCVAVLNMRKTLTQLNPNATTLVRSDLDSVLKDLLGSFGKLDGLQNRAVARSNNNSNSDDVASVEAFVDATE
ncbi:unnamed protein product [Ambrosiozyma monospora]|uniref:Unnamed protein product n=1 Tax=Ambrosiozyma monospora TaxID=43982 RepID=A0A9W7DKC8_AMBMO|nr:unnamed protein product [Ambrosiozyma monospora]